MNQFDIHSLPPVLTVREASRVMRVGYNRMYEIVRREGFPVVREGWKFLIPRDAFFKWLEGQAGITERGDAGNTANSRDLGGTHESL